MADKKIIVSKSGESNFSKVQDAVNAAADGDEIFVKGGVYNENFIIDKAVSITGDENDVPEFSLKGENICKVSAAASFSFIHFSGDGTETEYDDENGSSFIVEVSSDAVFNNCEVSGFFDSGIKVYGQKVKAEFYNCDIHDGNGNGFVLVDGCNAVIKNCSIYEIGENGIYIENASPIIENCEIYDCDSKDFAFNSAGIRLLGSSKGVYSNCKIYNIKGRGIVVKEGSCPTVENCEIYNCERPDGTGVGIILFDSSKGAYKNCVVHDIEGYGVEVQGESCPDVEGFEVYGCGDGIIVRDNTRGSYHNCKIHDIQGAGVSVNENSCPDVYDCEIYNCSIDGSYGFGIILFNNSTGSYKNCKIHGICGRGIEVQGEACPNVENCEIFDCTGGDYFIAVGTILWHNGKGTYKNCKIHGIYGYGVLVLGECSANLTDCEIYDCHAWNGASAIGLASFENGTGNYNNCVIHEIEGNGIEANENSSARAEGCEIYNCQAPDVNSNDDEDDD